MSEDTRMTPEQVGKSVIPAKTGQTVRLWCKNKALPYTKDSTGFILISHYALKKWCKNNGVELKGGENA